jgi:hypothetical protein
MQGKLLRQYFSEFCIFFPDGRLLTGGEKGLKMYDKDMHPIWEKALYVHHEVVYDAGSRELLVKTAEIIGDSRSDVVKTFDLNGNQKREFRLQALQEPPIGEKIPLHGGEEVFPNTHYELTHLNTFLKIPTNKSKLSAFEKGNYLINDRYFGIFVLNPELKKILWSYSYRKHRRSVLHDVQVLPNGNLFFYENKNFYTKQENSSLEEFDPVKNKTVWRFFPNNPEKLGQNPIQGSVQLLPNGHILYSTNMAEGFDAVEITRAGKEVWRIPIRDSNVVKLDRIKRLDLSAFLKNNSGF